MEKELAFLRKNKKYIKHTAIAKELGIDIATFSRIINKTKDTRGYETDLPEKYNVKLKQIINTIFKC